MRAILTHLCSVQHARDATARALSLRTSGAPAAAAAVAAAVAAGVPSHPILFLRTATAAAEILDDVTAGVGGGPSAAAALNLVGGSALAGGSSVAAVAKALTSALASGRLGAGLSADSETVRTLVMLLSPGSPLLLCASAAVVALQSVTSRPNFAPEAVLAFDAGERAGVGEGAAPAGQDVLRAIVQVRESPPTPVSHSFRA